MDSTNRESSELPSSDDTEKNIYEEPATVEPVNLPIVEKNKEVQPEQPEIKQEVMQNKEEDAAIDLSVWKNKIKDLVKKAKSEKVDDSSDDEGINNNSQSDKPLNFRELKTKFVGFFKGGKEDASFNSAKKYVKKNAKWIIPVLCIVLAIFLSSYFRMMSSSLPITQGWAENSVYGQYRSQLAQRINQQYPNLPEQNREVLVDREFATYRESNQEQLDRDVASVRQQFKSQFQDDNGDTYLLAIDPYLWFSQSRNVINHGHLGDKLINGEPHFSLRDGRLDKKSSVQLHPYFAAYFYKFIHFFKRDITLMRALFLTPVVLIGLALIPAFFIGRKVAGNVGGLFAAVFLGVNPSLIGRTAAGFADTDPYNIMLPLFIAWFIVEAYTVKSNRIRWILSGLAGLGVGLFAAAWSGWAFMFWFVIGAIVLSVLIKLLLDFKDNKFKFKTAMLTSKAIKMQGMMLLIFVLASGLFTTWFKSFKVFRRGILIPVEFTTLKSVGIKSLWPNVLTTVAEFNTTSFGNIISQLGGKLLFFIAALGLIFSLFKRNGKRHIISFFMIGLWFAGTMYAFTKGVRFAILIVPPFSLALGIAFGITYERASKWLKNNINIPLKVAKVLMIAVLALFLITPLGKAQSVGKNEVPSMNDAWYGALTKIKGDTPDSIITSWWDFGHWFVAIAERRVTFDGGDQGERIHWVGKSLRTDNEDEAVGILRMLNCVQEQAPHTLDEFTGDTVKSIEILNEVLPISDRNVAHKKYRSLGLTAKQADVMIEQTHCQNLLPNYYITSEDMIGKAGVWGHFGSWNFQRAKMYQSTNKLGSAQGIAYLMKNFNFTEQEASKVHAEIKTTAADRWIAPWPGYLSGWRGCEQVGESSIRCIAPLQGQQVPILIDTNSFNVSIPGNDDLLPNSLVYVTKDDVIEKEFEGRLAGFSIVLAPQGDGYRFLLADPLQAAGMFTRLFFLEGHASKCFSKFDDRRQITGAKIITWKVDWDCKQENNVFFEEVEDMQDTEMADEMDDHAVNESMADLKENRSNSQENDSMENISVDSSNGSSNVSNISG